MWQIHVTQIPCNDGTRSWGINLLDDQSRYLLAETVELYGLDSRKWRRQAG